MGDEDRDEGLGTRDESVTRVKGRGETGQEIRDRIIDKEVIRTIKVERQDLIMLI
jgi:hypothetical protein